MSVYEDDTRDDNYYRTLPEMSRGGGGNESGSLNAQSLIDRIKGNMGMSDCTATQEYKVLTCPFCDETDFDAAGLKQHLLAGYCEAFNETAIINRPSLGSK